MIQSTAIHLFRNILISLAWGTTAFFAVSTSADSQENLVEPGKVSLEIHKSPNCGCCGDWVTHMEEAGFATWIHNHNADNLHTQKQKLGVEPNYQSCHTAVTKEGEYFFEGHIPAKVIKQFLQEKPDNAIGLAVPGMPVGSPGMEMGTRFDVYEVIQINRDGSAEVYARIDSAAAQY